jgi:type I restriction enzyme S subunit
MPRGWKLNPLRELADVIAGQSPPSETYRDEPTGLPFFQGKTDFGPLHPIARKWCDQPYKVAEVGDVLLSVRAPVGPTNIANVRSCIGRGLCAIRPRRDLDRRYLLYFLRSIEPSLAALGSGNTFHAVSTKQVASLQIPTPPLSDQRRIADRLELAMTESATAKAALVAQRAEAIRLGTAAVEAALGGRVVATSDDSLVRGGNWIAITNVAQLESGHTPSRKRPEWWGGDVPWISLPDIRQLDGTLATVTGERTNTLGLANSSARLLPPGTVVFCRDVNVGFVTVMGIPMSTSQHFVNWVPGKALRSWYLAYALIAARQYLRDLSEGSLIKTIYMPRLRGLHLRLPTLKEQDRILARINNVKAGLEAMVAPLDRQAAALDSLGPSLLASAFQGKL